MYRLLRYEDDSNCKLEIFYKVCFNFVSVRENISDLRLQCTLHDIYLNSAIFIDREAIGHLRRPLCAHAKAVFTEFRLSSILDQIIFLLYPKQFRGPRFLFDLSSWFFFGLYFVVCTCGQWEFSCARNCLVPELPPSLGDR